VNSQHRHTNRNYRPADTEYDAAKAVADDAGLKMNTLTRAFLRLLAADPQGVLRLLRPHIDAVVEDTPTGRPRRTDV
jgi:hypothetical protein